jgi:hypothetical protein
MATRELKGSTIIGKETRTTKQIVDEGWPSPEKKAGKARAKKITTKAQKAIAKAKKSKQTSYYPPKSPKKK